MARLFAAISAVALSFILPSVSPAQTYRDTGGSAVTTVVALPFTPSSPNARMVPIPVGASDSSGPLPTGSHLIVSNAGSNLMYCNVFGVAATSADQPVVAGGWVEFGIPAGVSALHCIAHGGASTAYGLGGVGIATGAGAGGGGGGGSSSISAQALSAAPSYTTGSYQPLWLSLGGTLQIDAPPGSNLLGALNTGSYSGSATAISSFIAGGVADKSSGNAVAQTGVAIGGHENTATIGATLSHASTTALGTSMIAKGAAGNLASYNCTAIAGGSAGYCIAYNGTAAPSTGALTGSLVLDFCYFGATAQGCSLTHMPSTIAFSSGIVILVTSAASPFTYTTGTDTAAIEADYF